MVNGSPQTNTVQYIYEGNQAIGEVRNGQLSHSLLTGLFIDEHLARTAIATNGQVQSQAQLTDALGSVIALANAQTSSINTSYSYSPYGQTQATGETSSNNQQYTGREAGVEGEAGLYYYRARYYDPVLKRFISEDPIRLEGGLNVYAYVEGDPVSLVDPLGEAGNGGVGNSSGRGTNTPYKHCRDLKGKPGWIECKNKTTGKWDKKKAPPDWEPKAFMSCDENCQSTIEYVFVGGILIIGACAAAVWVPAVAAAMGVGLVIAQ